MCKEWGRVSSSIRTAVHTEYLEVFVSRLATYRLAEVARTHAHVVLGYPVRVQLQLVAPMLVAQLGGERTPCGPPLEHARILVIAMVLGCIMMTSYCSGRLRVSQC